MRQSILILMVVVGIQACASTNTRSINQTNIPVFDYENNLSNYLVENKNEIGKNEVEETLSNADKTISSFLRNVGQRISCQQYFPGGNQISIPKVKSLISGFVGDANNFAEINNSNFYWEWDSGSDIKDGFNVTEKLLESSYTSTDMEYRCPFIIKKTILSPRFSVEKHEYFLKFKEGPMLDKLMSKAFSVIYGKCRKAVLASEFELFPNGFSQLELNTYDEATTSNIEKIIKWKGKPTVEDRKRYDKAHRVSPFKSLFVRSPCTDFQKEYYKILKGMQYEPGWS